MAKKDNFNNNDPISKAVDLLLENTEDLTTVFKEGGLYKELTKRLVEKMLNSEMQIVEWQPFLGLFFGRHFFMIFNWS